MSILNYKFSSLKTTEKISDGHIQKLLSFNYK